MQNLQELERYLDARRRFGMKPGLDRIITLLEACGNPHAGYTCVHIAGTNGKGSTAAITESVLRAAGIRTGLYTSPHLHSYLERIRINGRPVDADTALASARTLVTLQERMKDATTYFEFMTALALNSFLHAGVEVAVIETGLGGRLDATAIVNAPCAAITSIDHDHQAQLGKGLASIAAEKAGIIRKGAFISCGMLPDEARDVILNRCRRESAVLREVGSDILVTAHAHSPRGSVISVRGSCGNYPELFLPLAGYHQALNCGVALGLVEGVRVRGTTIGDHAVREGIARVQWPGRFEVLSRDPCVIVDGAHNPAGARAVAAALEACYPEKRWILLLGTLADKDVGGICDPLLPCAGAVVATQAPSVRRLPVAELARSCRSLKDVEVKEIPEPRMALREAYSLLSKGVGEGILVTGSLYLVGEIIRIARGENSDKTVIK